MFKSFTSKIVKAYNTFKNLSNDIYIQSFLYRHLFCPKFFAIQVTVVLDKVCTTKLNS